MKQNTINTFGLASPPLQHPVSCCCSICQIVCQEICPQLSYDHDLSLLLKSRECRSAYPNFLRILRGSKHPLPPLRWLDMVLLREDQVEFGISNHNRSQPHFIKQCQPKSFLFDSKDSLDLEYQKNKYVAAHAGFAFAQFDHQSEKLIKEFESTLRYTSPYLRRMAYVKFKDSAQEIILSKSQLNEMFEGARQNKFADVEYMQVYPMMCGEEEQSRVYRVKYFRSRACTSKAYKLAERYLSTWIQRNSTVAEQQRTAIKQMTVLQLMDYYTAKLFLYFEHATNHLVEQSLVEFVTNDNHATYYLKSVECLQIAHKQTMASSKQELPKSIHYTQQQHISLPNEMQRLYQGFQKKYQQIQNQKQEREDKISKDKEYSDMVYKTVVKGAEISFKDVLKMENTKEKDKLLGLNH